MARVGAAVCPQMLKWYVESGCIYELLSYAAARNGSCMSPLILSPLKDANTRVCEENRWPPPVNVLFCPLCHYASRLPPAGTICSFGLGWSCVGGEIWFTPWTGSAKRALYAYLRLRRQCGVFEGRYLGARGCACSWRGNSWLFCMLSVSCMPHIHMHHESAVTSDNAVATTPFPLTRDGRVKNTGTRLRIIPLSESRTQQGKDNLSTESGLGAVTSDINQLARRCMVHSGSTRKAASLVPMCSERLTLALTSFPLLSRRLACRTGTELGPSIDRTMWSALSEKLCPPQLK